MRSFLIKFNIALAFLLGVIYIGLAFLLVNLIQREVASLAMDNAAKHHDVLSGSSLDTVYNYEQNFYSMVRSLGPSVVHNEAHKFFGIYYLISDSEGLTFYNNDNNKFSTTLNKVELLKERQSFLTTIDKIFDINSQESFYAIYYEYGGTSYVALVSANQLLPSSVASYITSLFAISVPEGAILASSTNIPNRALLEMIRANNTDEEALKLSLFLQDNDQQSYIETINYGGEATVLSVTKFKNYAFVSFMSKDKIVNSNPSIESFTYGFALASIVIFIVAAFFAYLLSYRKASDTLVGFIAYARGQTIILKVNSRGKILSRSVSFKMSVIEHKKYTNIIDIEWLDGDYTREQKLEMFKTQESFVASFPSMKGEAYFNFVPIRSGLTRLELIGENITEKYLQRLALTKAALTSHVTNLPNVVQFNEDVKYFIEKGNLYKNTLILLNIVSFANFNKIFGMSGGDQILRVIANKLKEIEENDHYKLYHLGTDEFLIMCSNISKWDDAELLAKKISDDSKKPITVNDNSLLVKFKMGILPLDKENIADLNNELCRAYLDLALRKARSSYHRDFVVFDLTLKKFSNKETQLVTAISEAIQNREFEMFYQPQFNNEIEEIVGFEALIRWNNEEYRGVTAQEFISLAERHQLINEIGNFVVDETFKVAQYFSKENIAISINVSPVQMMQSGFANEMISKFREYELKPGTIAIEVTETFLMESMEIVVEKLKVLRSAGFAIHLDDFGTGYSSLLYLKDLPIDLIKIDKEFVRNLATDKYSRAIVAKVISMAEMLDLSVISEGVETQDVNQILKKMGCNIIQGYLIGKAIKLEEAIERVHNQVQNRKNNPHVLSRIKTRAKGSDKQ